MPNLTKNKEESSKLINNNRSDASHSNISSILNLDEEYKEIRIFMPFLDQVIQKC